MKFLRRLIALPEPDNSEESNEELEFLKDMNGRTKLLEKEVCGETLEEAVENGSIKGKRAKEMKQRLNIIAEL